LARVEKHVKPMTLITHMMHLAESIYTNVVLGEQ